VARGVRHEGGGGLGDVAGKTFGGTVIRPDAILASSSASSLYRRGTWLSSMP
jgi:pantoate kinase